MPFLRQMLARILLPQAKEALELAALDSNPEASVQLGANSEHSQPLFFTL